MSAYERVGSGYDPGAAAHELVGRDAAPCRRRGAIKFTRIAEFDGLCPRCHDQTTYSYCAPRSGGDG